MKLARGHIRGGAAFYEEMGNRNLRKKLAKLGSPTE